MENLKVIDTRLTIDEIKKFSIGWEPWHNRQDRGYEGPEYRNTKSIPKKAKIAIVSAWYNEELLAPLFLKHYSFVDEIHIILDTATNDRTLEIISADPRVIIHKQTYPPDGLDWTIKQARVDDVYSQITAEWVFSVDADEFLFKRGEEDIKAFLDRQEGDIMWAKLWQVYRHVTDEDIDYTKPPLLQRRHGIPLEPESMNYHFPDRAYLKPIIVRGGKEPKWSCRCHTYKGTLQECREWMEGAHWHMADPTIAIRRRMQTRARQGQKNLLHGLGLQNHYISEKTILYECWLHRFDPIVIYTGVEEDSDRREDKVIASPLEEIPEILSTKGRIDYFLSEIDKIFDKPRNGAIDKALAEAFMLFPEQAIYLNRIGECLIGKGKLDEASRVLETALLFNPNYGELWCNIGYIAFQRNEYEKAFVFTKKALELDKTNAIYWENLKAIEEKIRSLKNREKEQLRT
ncbi:MAG: tetratricopeptide repeat protein [Syntrophales bacterium]|nr:tetratricopeptide repeat protein [Syntrophales bacterium]